MVISCLLIFANRKLKNYIKIYEMGSKLYIDKFVYLYVGCNLKNFLTNLKILFPIENYIVYLKR